VVSDKKTWKLHFENLYSDLIIYLHNQLELFKFSDLRRCNVTNVTTVILLCAGTIDIQDTTTTQDTYIFHNLLYILSFILIKYSTCYLNNPVYFLSTL